ncbi:unnamed protein product [Rotaria magnacalcarata]|uniref:Uncharacterized protein n=2 Tax=Rotaria magnacalcarata TaxID=392030 RepID=A0A816QS87_9BILA|nr:unnamed protein product [Rotaria magnacalcarata]
MKLYSLGGNIISSSESFSINARDNKIEFSIDIVGKALVVNYYSFAAAAAAAAIISIKSGLFCKDVDVGADLGVVVILMFVEMLMIILIILFLKYLHLAFIVVVVDNSSLNEHEVNENN